VIGFFKRQSSADNGEQPVQIHLP